MDKKGKGLTPYQREVKKRRLILLFLILIFLVLIIVMINGLVRSSVKAYKIAKATPTPTPTMFARITHTPVPTEVVTPTPGPVVMIDPGHGGIDIGTDAGGYADVFEKGINLSIGLKVRDKLKELGFTVLMIREEDVYISLDDRLRTANASDASAYISIHLNALEGDTKASGCEVYYNGSKNENNDLLAECIVNGICDSTGARNRGIKEDDFEVLLTSKPAVLAECGFMTSETEYPLLKDDSYQELIAQGIVDGLLKYYKKLNGAEKKDE
jgi:N-acetylmuramoyl-L-alanine amidase